tara:strand:- start:378 stop:494 length:117 start_codon:yes stop_codon:yes gene_type:complete
MKKLYPIIIFLLTSAFLDTEQVKSEDCKAEDGQEALTG